MDKYLPGLLLCCGGAALAVLANRALPEVSALLVAILLGALLANTVEPRPSWGPGVAFASKKLLRAGIVLLGLQLVLGDIVALGAGMVLVVVAVVTLGVAGGLLVGRMLGLNQKLSLLIASGFSICGAAAVAGVDSVIEAEERDVATAIALVVLFGTGMIPLVPLLADLLGMGQYTAGLWAGGSIHEVAQVVAAGAAIGPEALKVAVVVKLARVLMLAPLTIAIGWWLRRRHVAAEQDQGHRPPLVPLFVLGFLAMVVVASLHLLPHDALAGAKLVQTALLAAAMFGLGMGVRITALAGVGPRPFLLGALTTLWVASIAWVGVALTH
ncbi:YeiH family protein [Luteococcus peritonei]|uniref:YeiH family protein n=1 Tax=Luteococcus peritonei TaxID=88874 RepID=A0ABW4RRM1_9ACTN